MHAAVRARCHGQRDPLSPVATVSVCIPTYNAERHIEATIDSVRRQTYTKWELIVVDDCSTDRTRAVVQSVHAKSEDPRMRLHVNPSRLGMARNWNRALSLATGEFAKILCHDDELSPDCLEAQVKAIQDNPQVCLVTCGRTIVNARGAKLFVRRSLKADGIYAGRRFIRHCVGAGTNVIGEPSAVLLRRATLQKTGMFRESVVYYTDLDLWLRLLLHGDLYFISASKVMFRVHPRSATRNLEREMLADYFRVVDSICGETSMPLGPAERAWISLKVRALNAIRRAIYKRWEDG